MAGHLQDTPIEFLKGVGPKRASTLTAEMGIRTFADLLFQYPFRYIDRSQFHKVSEIQNDLAYIQLRGRIGRLEKIGAKRASRLVAEFYDDSGRIELVWFKGISWVERSVNAGEEYIVFGKPSQFKGKWNIAHPELEKASEHSVALNSQLQPVYHSSEKLTAQGLHSKGIARLQWALQEQVGGKMPENLTPTLIQDLRLMPRNAALREVHFPSNPNTLQKAVFRLKFEELFFVQLQLLRMQVVRNQKIRGVVFGEIGEHFNQFYAEKLPFELTGAQKRVIKEIRRDMGSGRQMNRLLQGDVGSGKTMVALMVCLIALDNGYQSALMAPTEILAIQHFESISGYLDGTGMQVGLLTGSTKEAQRKRLHARLESGELHLLIGTHALLEDRVQFQQLGLVVIDEQHRFGVAQRSRMWRKNKIPPHVLVMTATPIPRTLAMTLYGDLDVSVIDELPPGRKPIRTVHRYDSSRLKVFGFMHEEIAKGRQVYVVYPLIKESEKLDYKDLMDGYESISRAFPLPDFRISIVHGKMKPADKEAEMERFASGHAQILVATTVIEVGVNVPNASVMVIESAERFGLSQLHQLRGRVGRGAEQSFCILMTGVKLSNEGRQRMEIMCRSNDGFEIAEEDLRLRGPGNLMGTQQSGLLDLTIADLSKDNQILGLAREQAAKVLENDPNLMAPEHQAIREHYDKMVRTRTNWSRIS